MLLPIDYAEYYAGGIDASLLPTALRSVMSLGAMCLGDKLVQTDRVWQEEVGGLGMGWKKCGNSCAWL